MRKSKPLSPSRSPASRARSADSIIEPSPHRVPPPCPHFTHCGGCHYQHTTYEQQLAIKKEILRESLRRMAKLDLPFDIEVHPSPPWNYRNRSRLQVRTGQERVGPKFAAGYFKLASHDLLAVEECPISSPLINRGIASLWQSGRAGKVPAGIREVEFFANADDTQLLLDVSCSREARRAAVRTWAEDFRAAMPEIAGVVAFREPNPGDRKASAQEILVTVRRLAPDLSDTTRRLPRQRRILLPDQPPPDRRTGQTSSPRANPANSLSISTQVPDCFPQPWPVTFITSFLLRRHRHPQPIFPTISPRMERQFKPPRSSTWPVRKIRRGSGRAQSSLILFISPT